MSRAIASTLDERTQRDARLALSAPKGGLRDLLPFVGPAAIAAVAYIDPGNFATNIEAGSKYGYSLLWVVLWANVAAMFVQIQSAKLGIATGLNLAEIIARRWPAPVVWLYWLQAEAVAIFTDLAEFLGATIGLSILTGMPIVPSAAVSAVVVFGLLAMERRGFRPMELIIGSLLLVVALAFFVELFISPVDWPAAFRGALLPALPRDDEAVYLAAGILGATVMPHVIYLHSGLTQKRLLVSKDERPKLVAAHRQEIVIALGVAGLVNLAMLSVAAASFHDQALASTADLRAYGEVFRTVLGAGAALLFAVALFASGISSSMVGTMSGQLVMQGFVGFSIPIWLRRALTLLPSIVVVACGFDLTKMLILSQVVLSFGIPFALLPLMTFTSRSDVMGRLANSPFERRLGWLLTASIAATNGWLLTRVLFT